MTPLDRTIVEAKSLLLGVGPIGHRKMFGGAGLYADDVMFALIAGADIYLKADDDLATALAAAGSHPFVYEGKGRPMTMRYWRLPGAARADPALACDWAARAIAVARRANASRPPRPRKRR